MSRLELLTRLNAKNQQYSNGAGKSTREAALQGADVAMALSAIDDRIGSLLLALKYAEDLPELLRRSARWAAFLRAEQKRHRAEVKEAEQRGHEPPARVRHGVPPELWKAGVWQAELTAAMVARWLPIAREEAWRPGLRRVGDRTVTRDLRQVVQLVCLHAILEYAVPLMCPECKGRKYRYPKQSGEAAKPCQRCRAAGTVAVSGRERARELGFSEATWRRHWARRYERMLSFLEWAEAAARKQFYKATQREEG